MHCMLTILLFIAMSAPGLAGINQWTPQGPFGHSANCLAIAPGNPNVMIIGGMVNDIYRSTDGGHSWRLSAQGIQNGPFALTLIMAVIIGKAQPDLALLGTSKSVYRSLDGGMTWNSSSQGFPSDCWVQCLLEVGPAGGEFIAGTKNHGVFRSIDDGVTWSGFGSGLDGRSVNALAAEQNGMGLFATTDQGVSRSDDGGATWHAVLAAGPCTALHLDAMGNVYAGAYGDIIRSHDRGVTWTGFGLFCFSAKAIATNPLYPERIFIGSKTCGGFSRSLNNGTTWETIDSGSLDPDINCLAMSPDGVNLFAGSGFNFTRSTDNGTTWFSSVTGMSGVPTNAMAYAADRQTLFAGTSGGIFRRHEPTRTWEPLKLGLVVNSLVSDGRTPSALYAATDTDGIWKSVDGGTTWTEILSDMFPPHRWMAAIVVSDPAKTVYAAGYGTGIIKSSDQGATWTLVSDGLTDDRIFSLAGDPKAPTTLYAGTWDGLFRTTDGGGHWSKLYDIANSFVYAIMVDPDDSKIIYMGTNWDLYKSIDGGTTWSASSSGIAGGGINSFYMDPITGDLFAGTIYCPSRSRDKGSHWAQYGSRFVGGSSASCILLDPLQNDTFLLGGGSGCWSLTPSSDLNADGIVNALDLELLAAYLGGTVLSLPAGEGSGDINLDGHVDSLDLIEILNQF